MHRVITELKRRPVVYGLSFFIILTAYLAGGMAALRLEETAKNAVTAFFYAGESYLRITAKVMGKRLVLMIAQAFFGIWMAGTPLSVLSGMLVQISLSMPWWCMAEGTADGVFLAIQLLLPCAVYLVAGTYVMAVEFGHLHRMMKEMHKSRSAAEKIRDGMRPAEKMLAIDAVMIACVPLEVLFLMNIA